MIHYVFAHPYQIGWFLFVYGGFAITFAMALGRACKLGDIDIHGKDVKYWEPKEDRDAE